MIIIVIIITIIISIAQTGVLGAAAVSRETSWDLCGAAG